MEVNSTRQRPSLSSSAVSGLKDNSSLTFSLGLRVAEVVSIRTSKSNVHLINCIVQLIQ